ncbi:hypothetical protein DM785_17950 (plasmid) [Deinococcus actinosclerus]|nr:hypothetical protein DM785_17950 [Deinococcus actinosclerus]
MGAAELMVGCLFPMAILWGREHLLLYNPAFSALLGAKHPGGLGRPVAVTWPVDEAVTRRVWQGESVKFEDHPCPLTRRGYAEETYFTLSYSPVRDGQGAVCGVLVTALETTAQVLALRRAETLRCHAEALGDVQTVGAFLARAASFQAGADVPWLSVHFAADPDFPDTLRAALHGARPVTVQWERAAGQCGPALVVPVDGLVPGATPGVVVLGLNERVPLDDPYRAFLVHYARQAQATLMRVQSHDHLALHRSLEVERGALRAFMEFMEAVGDAADLDTLTRQAAAVLQARYPDAAIQAGRPPGSDPDGAASLVLPVTGRGGAEAHGAVALRLFEPGSVQGEARAAQLAYGTPADGGLLTVVMPGSGGWTDRDRTVFQAVGRGLQLALSRVQTVQRLAQDREALSAFMQFTELAADSSDVRTLAVRAAEVLRSTLPASSAVYLERMDSGWVAREMSGVTDEALVQQLRRGLPLTEPTLELAVGRREATYLEGEAITGQAPPHPYRTAALYPLFPPDAPVGILGIGSVDRAHWSDRDRAVFQAVGKSFRLALTRAAHLEQIGRQRERLADLNAELGQVIAQAARTLEAPARYLSHWLTDGTGGKDLSAEPFDPLIVQDEVSRLRGAARDLQGLAALETHPPRQDLISLRDVFGAAQDRSAAAGVTWQVGPLPIVRGDAALLAQALEVLLGFTLSPTRGVRFVGVHSLDLENEVRIVIEDDGLGLSSEEASTLFDLTVRSAQRVPLMDGGSLGQVRRILARQGGWAWAEARLSGAAVVLALPKQEEVHAMEALFMDEGDERR